MTPTFNNVLLREIKKDKTTESGIILTQDVDTGQAPALVEAVGPECKYVQPGDVVFCVWKDSVPITTDGVQGVLINEEKVVGIKERRK